MKRITKLTLVVCIITGICLSACGVKDVKSNLIITNESPEIISNIAIQRDDQTDVMGGKLEPKEKCSFEMGIKENCIYKVEFEDKSKQIIHSNEFISNFSSNKGEIVKINILKDNNGKWSLVLAD
ncbi:hypothetical protein [Clostridium sp.]|uniref:hypothetical protein n=1 Tax=Clostridium sp. TaxID=1506 RepID=UPI003D6DA19F